MASLALRLSVVALAGAGGHHDPTPEPRPEIEPGPVPRGYRSRKHVLTTCEPQQMMNPKHPEYEWRFIWDDLLPFQRLSLESLGWNSTMWDVWNQRPSPYLFAWPPPPIVTTTTSTTTEVGGLAPITPQPTPASAGDGPICEPRLNTCDPTEQEQGVDSVGEPCRMQTCDDYAEEIGCDELLNNLPATDVAEICLGCQCGGVPSVRRLRGSRPTATTLTTLTAPKPHKTIPRLRPRAPRRKLDGHTACDRALNDAELHMRTDPAACSPGSMTDVASDLATKLGEVCSDADLTNDEGTVMDVGTVAANHWSEVCSSVGMSEDCVAVMDAELARLPDQCSASFAFTFAALLAPACTEMDRMVNGVMLDVDTIAVGLMAQACGDGSLDCQETIEQTQQSLQDPVACSEDFAKTFVSQLSIGCTEGDRRVNGELIDVETLAAVLMVRACGGRGGSGCEKVIDEHYAMLLEEPNLNCNPAFSTRLAETLTTVCTTADRTVDGAVLDVDKMAVGLLVQACEIESGVSFNYANISRNWTNDSNWTGAYVIPGIFPTTTPTTTNLVMGTIGTLCYFDLNDDQRMAVHGLGYTINSWNCFQPCDVYDLGTEGEGITLGSCEKMYETLKNFYRRPYSHLSQGEKDALTVLGVSKTTWNFAYIDFNRGSWDDLDAEELNAATHLGFSLFTWEKCRVDVEDYLTEKDGDGEDIPPMEIPEIMEHYATTSQPPTPTPKDPLRSVKGELTLLGHTFAEVSGMQSVFRKALQLAFAKVLSKPDVAFQARRVMIVDLRVGREGMEGAYGEPLKKESIIVDFILRQFPDEQQQGEYYAVAAYGKLKEFLEDETSDLRNMNYLKPFLEESLIIEVPMDRDELALMDSYMEFEKLRGVYNASNACELRSDSKNGVNFCRRSSSAPFFLAVVVALAGYVF
jgi:hypothetical protein